MVKPRTFGAFTDVRGAAHATAYSDLLVPTADATPEQLEFLYSLFVVHQEADGRWNCPLSSTPFLHRKKQLTCAKRFDGPELVMKHVGKHMLADVQQLGGDSIYSLTAFPRTVDKLKSLLQDTSISLT